MVLSEECLAIVHKDIRKKLQDMGSFSIHYYLLIFYKINT